MVVKKIALKELKQDQQAHSLTYTCREFTEPVPRYELPAESMPASVAYRICRDELNLDGNPSLNLASFVTTWMEPEAEKLIFETLNKNLVDHDEYPQTQEIQKRCINMLARLFNASESDSTVGTATVGSSEAVMLAALSHKWRWRERRRSQGKPADRPNIVMGGDIQVVWEKYARYFDVEPRVLPMQPGQYILCAEEVASACDENTTAVVAVLGTTFTGQLDPIEEIDARLRKLKQQSALDIPLHVDAASGGFIIPFTNPHIAWDFALEQVQSINVSGHKYGLVYPGIGWALWKDHSLLPADLVFKVNYLGGEMPTFNLNFSRGASHIIAQYYNFLRLGRAGYRRVAAALVKTATYLAGQLKRSGYFDILSSDSSMPVVVVALKGQPGFSVFNLSERLRSRG